MKNNKIKKDEESIEDEHLIKNEEDLEETDKMVTITREEYEALQQELANAREDAVENLNAKLRTLAEFSNYKKRLDREQAQMRQTITGDLTKKYLVILDDLGLALKNRPTQGEGAAWAQGIELITKKFNAILEQLGIEPVAQENEPFDPTCHEAISSEASPDHDCEVIIEVMQQGYKLADGRLLRPALVRVAR
ncbi:MAG: nucleotide exchange factor GrpE [Anaerolineaceae bacterium]|jgi:molecular chaperone GrpE|nr:nucleotide exchange factor GrpE [Anaerolineaceae bacterium]